jgi:hypothetical protein
MTRIRRGIASLAATLLITTACVGLTASQSSAQTPVVCTGGAQFQSEATNGFETQQLLHLGSGHGHRRTSVLCVQQTAFAYGFETARLLHLSSGHGHRR